MVVAEVVKVVAGIGCRKGASATDIVAAVDAALARARLGRDALSALSTSSAKSSEPCFGEAVRLFGVPLASVGEAELAEADRRTLTFSDASHEATGLSSLSEAAALAAAGSGARLLGPRQAIGGATCALAVAAERP